MQKSLFTHVFDASSLIDIEGNRRIADLRRLRDMILMPEKVAKEISQPGTPLERFVNKYPDTVTSFQPKEKDIYLRIRSQVGIDDGEAAAIAVAINRNLPLVIEDKKGRAKAANHGVKCIKWSDFLGWFGNVGRFTRG